MASNEEDTNEIKVEEIIDKAIEFLNVPEIAHQPITPLKRLDLDMPITIEEYNLLRNILMTNLNTYSSIQPELPLDFSSLSKEGFKLIHGVSFRKMSAFANKIEDFAK